MKDREFAVVLEGIRSDFRVFGEGLSALRDEMNQRFEAVDRRFDGVDRRLDQMDRRFIQVDQRFDQMDQRFDQMDRRFEQVDLQFTVVIQEIHGQRTEFDARLGTVEAKIGL